MTRSLSRQLKVDLERDRAIREFQRVPYDVVLDFHSFHLLTPINLPSLVRKRWGVSMATYWQRVMDVIDLPEAQERFPTLTANLLKRRDAERAFQRVALQQRIPVGHPDHGRRGD